MEEKVPVIEMEHITKSFPGIKANDDISLDLRKGEIHALLGENGAGKSTLMSVLFGLYTPEEGEIRKNGEVVNINNPNDATALNIGMVHQHFKLVDVFTVLDNIILGAETTKYGYLDRKTSRKRIEELSKKYGLYVDLDAKIEDITVGMQQRVEILKMLYRDNDILIFDEPTAVLTPQEIDELMQIMKNLANEGKSILFITHKLDEIMAVADYVTVLRKGKVVDGAKDLKDGAKDLKDGAKELKDGEKEFYDEGIKKLKDTLEDDLQDVLDRLEAIQSDDATYTSFTGKDASMSGSVKFIIETEGFDADDAE